MTVGKIIRSQRVWETPEFFEKRPQVAKLYLSQPIHFDELLKVYHFWELHSSAPALALIFYITVSSSYDRNAVLANHKTAMYITGDHTVVLYSSVVKTKDNQVTPGALNQGPSKSSVQF